MVYHNRDSVSYYDIYLKAQTIFCPIRPLSGRFFFCPKKVAQWNNFVFLQRCCGEKSAAFRKRVFALFRNVTLDNSQVKSGYGEDERSLLGIRFIRHTQRGVVRSSHPFDRESSPHVRMSREWNGSTFLLYVVRLAGLRCGKN